MTRTVVGCLDQLRLDRDEEIFEQIRSGEVTAEPLVRTTEIPPHLWIEVERVGGGVKRIREDKYGQLLTFAYAFELRRLRMSEDASRWNRAVKALIDALPDDVPIILWWW